LSKKIGEGGGVDDESKKNSMKRRSMMTKVFATFFGRRKKKEPATPEIQLDLSKFGVILSAPSNSLPPSSNEPRAANEFKTKEGSNLLPQSQQPSSSSSMPVIIGGKLSQPPGGHRRPSSTQNRRKSNSGGFGAVLKPRALSQNAGLSLPS
jgi:hypothetical protein